MPRVLLSFLFLNFSFLLAYAQPGGLDLSFAPQLGADDDVQDIETETEGKIYIGGDFIYYNGNYSPRIARLNSDGSLDSSFHVGDGLDGRLRKIAFQTDGKILLAGDFNTYNFNPSKGIVRVFPSGEIDSSFHVGTGINNRGITLAVQPDQRILVGGSFTVYNGVTVTRLIRLLPNGALDSTFNFANGPNGTVEEILLQSDGKIIIGGDFTQIGSNYRLRVARLNSDGILDPTFGNGFGLSAVVFAMETSPNNKLMVGGNFNSYNLQTSCKVARLNGDGNLDNSYPVGNGADSYVFDLKVLNDGSVLIAGTFTSFRGNPFPRLVKTDSVCTEDFDFNPGGSGADETINSIAIQPDGKILIGGVFQNYNGIQRKRIARLYTCLTPQPASILGPDSILCAGTYTYSVPAVAEAQSYQWTLPSGWTGSSDSTSITVVANGSGTISVKAFSDSCGYSYATTLDVYQTQIATPEICLVTVDSASTHTIVLWEKPVTSLIDSFFVHRLVSTNFYQKVGSVAYDSLSVFHDYGADPNSTYYFYKLSALDACGVESDKSPYHKTIHLQDQLNGNFNWNFYEIEDASNPVVNFKLYRANQPSSPFNQIGFIPGVTNQFTDPQYTQFDSSSYVLDVDWSIACNPTRTVNTTRSNIRHKYIINAVDEKETDAFDLFPNPAQNILYIRSKGANRIHLFNNLGQEVRTIQAGQKELVEVPISNLASGLYQLIIETEKSSYSTKFILE
ncbi:MAG: T9SS type A sorting domain-containing protein [Bacteroidia bacterium]|nr:T9SS type A sorting domain-containing protein [Bacteroidia bacterium]